MKKTWTREELEKLRKLAGLLSSADIAKELGRSRDSVKNQLSRLNLPKAPSKYRPFDADMKTTPEQPTGKQHWKFVAGVMVTVSLFLRDMTPEDREKAIKAAEGAARGLSGKQATLTAMPAKTEQLKPKTPPAKPLRQAVVVREYSALEWCPECHSPVSNWQEHKERMGHRRPA